MVPASRASLAFGALALVGILGIAFELGERYPFARFHMFDHRATAASRVIARLPGGEAIELSSLRALHCPDGVELFTADPDAPVPRCPVAAAYPEAERRVARYLERERADVPSSQPVELVRRTFSFPDPWAPPDTDDCVIAVCTAERR